MTRSTAVDIAKAESKENEATVVTLTSGVRVRLRPVSARFRDEARARIPDPPVPKWHDPERDEDVPNPDHPDYVKALQDTEARRAAATMDALVMFGMELVDGLPQDDGWLKRLQFLDRRGAVDLTGYDPNEPIDREFLYKRFIAVTDTDWAYIGPALQQVREEAVERAGRLFRRAGAGDAD